MDADLRGVAGYGRLTRTQLTLGEARRDFGPCCGVAAFGMLEPPDIGGDHMKPNEFLEYLWARPQTNALAQSLAITLVERGRFDLVPMPIKVTAPVRVAR
jgi:hypothetical protein